MSAYGCFVFDSPTSANYPLSFTGLEPINYEYLIPVFESPVLPKSVVHSFPSLGHNLSLKFSIHLLSILLELHRCLLDCLEVVCPEKETSVGFAVMLVTGQ